MKRHVVVVDDHPSVRTLVQAALAADDRFSVVGEAADGSEALAVVDAVGPDLVVLDLVMPHTDGLTTLRRMTESHPTIDVVVYSELVDERAAALAAGASAFVSKSQPIADLVDALATAAGRHPLLRFDDLGFQRTVLDALEDGFVVQDADGEIIYANPAAERILSLRAGQLVGLTSHDERWDAVHADGSPFSGADTPIVQARLTGAPVRNVVMGVRMPAGERRWMQVSAAPILGDPAASALGAVAMFSDITERLKHEREAQDSQAQTQRFLEALPIGVAVVEEGHVAFVNERGRDLLGIGAGDVAAGNGAIVDYFRPRRAGTGEPYPFEDLPIVRALFAGEPAIADDVVLDLRDGPLPIESYAAPVAGPDGDHRFAIAVFTDISERRIQEARLARALADLAATNSELTDFAAIAAHDLAAPLGAISGFGELLEERYGTELPAEAREWVRNMRSESERMRSFIHELLDYARAGAPTDAVGPVSMDDVTRHALDALVAEVAFSGADVVYDALPTVTGDAGRLVQVMQNLLANALKYRSPERLPVIRIDGARAGDEWVISVTDNGVGVPDDERARILAPFARGAAAGDPPGHGLGLTICRRIVERHGGRIWVEPVPEGGSRFRFALPVDPAFARRASPAEDRPAEDRPAEDRPA